MKFIAGNCAWGDKCKCKHGGVVTALAAAEQSAAAESKNSAKANAKPAADKTKDDKKDLKSKKARKDTPSPAKSSSFSSTP